MGSRKPHFWSKQQNVRHKSVAEHFATTKKAVMHTTASQAVTYEPNWVNKNKDPQRTTVNEASKKCQKNALIKRDTGE